MPVDRFYREFEAAFRGTRAEIIGRLEVYNDFLHPLLAISPSRKGLDLGCGRGEWLEVLGKTGFAAHGVDLDAGMLEDCFARGLSAEQGDAMAYLAKQPDHSHAIISGFHIAEHLPFGVLQELIAQALRVLEPAGLLILETPNPENLRVGAMTFHMDPTHNKPLPPGLLSFLARHYGFERAQVLRLQEEPTLRRAPTASLIDVFQGVSPDYALVAQKSAAPEHMQLFAEAFSKDRGLTLETLSERFEAGVTRKAEFRALEADVERLRDAVEQVRAELETRLNDIQNSTSWRITEPLRGAGRLLHVARSRVSPAAIADRVRPIGLTAALAVHRRPRLRKALVASVRAVPGLEGRIRAVLTMRQRSQDNWHRRHGPSQLTPKGRAIFEKLKNLRDQ